jgi:hypothetical protein
MIVGLGLDQYKRYDPKVSNLNVLLTPPTLWFFFETTQSNISYLTL